MHSSSERDRSVERLLRQSFQLPRSESVTESCLDAEALAAWIDGGLSGAAFEVAQAHVADCARCQGLVAALARINTGVPPAQTEHSARGWLVWLVPLSAAAAAVALWVAVPRNDLGRGADLARSIEVQRQAMNAPQADGTKSVEKSREQRAESKEQRTESTGQRVEGTLSMPPASGNAVGTMAPSDAPKKEAAGNAELRAKTEVLRSDVGQSEADNLSKQQVQSNAIPPAAAPALAAPARAAAPSPPSEKVLDSTRSADRRAEVSGVEILSPDPMVRWRIAGADVQRSTDGGARWASVPTGIAAELTAGAAPSQFVCWLVGRGGVVLLSTDGRSWRRVAFPETTDLSGVRAGDARTASVSTANGRTFRTTDAGLTWVP